MQMLTEGKPYPLGSHFDGKGTNFAIASAHCSRIELCLFDDNEAEKRFSLPSQNGEIWYGYLLGCRPGQHYGYRVYGDYQANEGHRFNPNKLTFDPYSRQLSHFLKESPLLFVGSEQPDGLDSATACPKSVVFHEAFDWTGDRFPRIPLEKTLIYEAHPKGFTQNHPDLPEEIRGSYAALGHPSIINHLKKMGITALELMPIAMHADENHLQKLALTNYWGYNTLAPFAIEPRYWSGRAGTTPLSEFCTSVKSLHNAGIEVILDVVFNHTAELAVDGPTVCLRGIDNASYYWNEPGGYSTNWSGCGNSLNANNPLTLRWIMDCLRYWINQCHVDGFRFDLGALLGRMPNFSATAPLFIAMRQDPVISKSKLFAEPWDIGADGYRLGDFPAPFSEWNADFRDRIRRFWLTNDASIADFASAFAGSSYLFHHHGRHPQASVNFITAHDGFTLKDLVSFNEKHNHDNGENNSDGHGYNYSFNHGTEGLEADDKTLAQRKASQRALLATLLLSQGIPMLLAGDEMGHSQRGNNNAYCQDNDITWLDWPSADLRLIEFCRSLIALRQQIATITTSSWWISESNDANSAPLVHWLSHNGKSLSPEDWNSQEIKTLQIRLANEWIVLVNARAHEQNFRLPDGVWSLKVSSAEQDAHLAERLIAAAGRSISVLRLQSK